MDTPAHASITIRYRRLPARVQRFTQALVARAPGCVVTLLDAVELARPMHVGGALVLEPGSPIVWFTFPGRWHDVGRFHLRDGTFSGFYANVIRPAVMEGDRWSITDLCLDVWRGADGAVALLDEDEFEGAVAAAWLDAATAERARHEAEALLAGARSGTWPSPEVHAWTLGRARAVLSRHRSTAPTPDRLRTP